MVLALRRLLFTLQDQSQAWVSRETGIPKSTLSYVARGIRALPKQYELANRNVYQREGYRRMEETGVSANQARRFSWYVPEKVTNVISTVNEKVKYLKVGYLGQKEHALGRSTLPGERKAILKEADVAIREGLRQSPYTYEEWERYGK